ncbi:scaffolding protein [Microbacterium phage Barnstormer]|uniref:Scaffolding protein n=1 Tax=Microbacterium phage Barnstormer TaxID=3028491 RepID=A0AAE9ZNR6_9CAUD|nr:scaffolding protein [Microbacterium phage Barnstormer]WDS52111.1 scaffolding protein [Microbacterium phage UtzChips]
MSDTAPNTDAPTTDESKETPEHPWGDDFDPARAWKALTSAREAEKELKAKLSKFEQAEQERADAEKTELEKLQARLEKAEQAAKDAARNAVLAKSGLPEELHAFVTGETDEAIAEQITKLTAALGASGKGDEDKADDPAPTTSRPQSALTPGHGGDEATFDADAIVAASL